MQVDTTRRTSKLNQLATVERGRSRHRPRNAPHLYGGPYPFIQTGEIKAAEFWIHGSQQTYSEAGLEQSRLWPSGTICVTIAANIAESGMLAVDACFPDSVVGVTAHTGKADPSFLKYALDYMKLRLQSVSGGTTQDNLSVAKLLSFDFPAPAIDAQRQVAGALRSFDDLIENNRRRIEILEEMARLLYREWFVHFRYPGHENVKLVDSGLGPIPDGWDVARLSDLVSTQYGYTESANTDPVGPHYLRGMDMNKTSFVDWSSVPFCPISELDRHKFAVQVGDVFVIRMADPGKVGICEREVDAVFASYLVRLRSTDGRITPYYLFFTLSDEPYQGWVTGASTGATRKSVSAKVMTEPSVVVPCTEVLERFDDAVLPVRSLLNNLLEQNALLRKARDLLLPRLLSGELDVSELGLEMETAGA